MASSPISIRRRSYERRSSNAANSPRPILIDVEVLSALRRLVRLGQVGQDRANDAVRDLTELPIIRCSHELLIDRIWELRHDLTSYDATYLALAEAMAIPLITRDAGLASVAERTVEVEVFPA